MPELNHPVSVFLFRFFAALDCYFMGSRSQSGEVSRMLIVSSLIMLHTKSFSHGRHPNMDYCSAQIRFFVLNLSRWTLKTD